MTRTEIERLSVVETKIDGIEATVLRMEEKLDAAMREKADCSDVEAIRDAQQANDRSISKIIGALILISVTMPVAIFIAQRLLSGKW